MNAATQKAAKVAKPARQLTEAALAAKAIRADLRTKYPAIKFSVTSENYSMGNSVNVKWTDGPLEHEVRAYLSGYRAGDFDPSQDLYEYSKPDARYPHRVQYISTSRHTSPAALAAARLALVKGWGAWVLFAEWRMVHPAAALYARWSAEERDGGVPWRDFHGHEQDARASAVKAACAILGGILDSRVAPLVAQAEGHDPVPGTWFALVVDLMQQHGVPLPEVPAEE